MTDVINNDADNTPTEKTDNAVDAGVRVAEQIIETAHTLKQVDNNRMLDLLEDVISKLNQIDLKLTAVEAQVINNTITVENTIDDLEEAIDEAEEVAEEVIGAVEKVDAPTVTVTETVEVREQPKKKKRVWL